MSRNLEISKKCIIFAENFERYEMAGRFLILGAGIKGRIGGIGSKDYTRRLPGHPESVVSVCKKPHYTKAQKKKMAQRPQVQRFCEVNKEASAIWHNPELKAEWAARHEAYMHEAKRHGGYIYVRLWDYIRHELNKVKAEAAESAPK